MKQEEFREHAHRLVDWTADYLQEIEQYPVQSHVQAGEVRRSLEPNVPQLPEDFADIFEDFIKYIVPGMTHWQHPSFFAYFPANSSPPSLLAEFLISALGAQCMSWNTSPAATELEEQMIEWMKQAFQLPSHWSGVIQPSVTIAGLCSLIAARDAATEGKTRLKGLAPCPQFVCYCSTEAHSSVDKIVQIAGIGTQYLRKIPVDATLAMDPDALQRAIARDRKAGLHPLFVVATIGTTSSGAIDPLGTIADICREEAVWLHVDAAYLGSALILPEFRETIQGLELVNSLALNPNKWMFTNFECTLHFIDNKDYLITALGTNPEYLKSALPQEVTNYRDWGIALGRRFHSLKLWFVLRSYGVKEIQTMLRAHISLGQYFADCVRTSSEFELLTEPSCNIVCFHYNPSDTTVDRSTQELNQLNLALLERVNKSGLVLLSHTKIREHVALRFVPAQTNVEMRHVKQAWQILSSSAVLETLEAESVS